MNGALKAAGLWGPVVAVAAAVTWLSHIPNPAPAGNVPDWTLHLAEFIPLAALAGRAVSAGRRRLSFGHAAAAGAGCMAFAALDELHQTFVPGRTASLRDWLFDLAAVVIGLSGAALWRRLKEDGAPPGRGAGILAAPGVTVPGRGAAAAAVPEVTLLGRGACHLCEEAERVMRPVLEEMGIGMAKVDVDGDEGLAALYGREVPVVLIDGRKAFKHRVDPARLRRKLDSALRRRL